MALIVQMGLFDHRRYPREAGHQMRETSKRAANAKRGRVKELQNRIVALLGGASPLSAREIAELLGEDEDNVRPRCSELASSEMGNLIEDSGERHPSRKGAPMIAWRRRA